MSAPARPRSRPDERDVAAAGERVAGLDRAALDRARLSRDPRFDGKFFIAVTSTRIYCRSICPARSPNPANVRYYATAAAAAAAGYRPCLRCRPEAAPGTPGWNGTQPVVQRALRLIEQGMLDTWPVDALAARLGISTRHLARLFAQHVGAAPGAVAVTRRLQFAKRLLDDTSLSITEVALAAGFGSLRRFNDAFRRAYHRAPRDVRRRESTAAGDKVVLRLAFRPPYDWGHVHASLAARAIDGVEQVDASGYTRTIERGEGHAVISVREIAGADALELQVCGATPAELLPITTTARRVFDLTADPDPIVRAFSDDPVLAPLVRARPGLRIAGAWDAFECAVLAVIAAHAPRGAPDERADRSRACVTALVERMGRAVTTGAVGLTRVFPSPAALAGAGLDALDAVGLSPAGAAALHCLARAVTTGALDFAGPAETVMAALVTCAGLDVCAASAVALRGLGEPDAFPVPAAVTGCVDPTRDDDLTPGGASDAALRARAEAWRPWRGYAAEHLRVAGLGVP